MILRIAVVIPTYNNPATIEGVIRDTLEETPYPIRVIDDGSSAPIEASLQDPTVRAARVSGRLEIHRLPENRGKGAAIRYAIDLGVRQDFTHLVTIDGDGQHYPREIPKLVDMVKRHPRDLVIGARRFAAPNVPESSKFGRKFSNFWVGFETGAVVSDSQSGFRAYPLFALQNLEFWTNRYDFEIEVLIRALWNGVGIQECEIDVYYPDPSERVSHFDKLWDNVRISLLNTLLVAVSLLKTKSPRAMAGAFGVGVFIGCTPFVGLRLWIALGVAVLFRLNAVFAMLGSRIGALSLTPLVGGISIWIGQKVAPYVGYNPEASQLDFSRGFTSAFGGATSLSAIVHEGTRHFGEWLIGGAILGVVLGAASAAAIWVVASRQRQKVERAKTEPSWKGRTRGGRFGNGFLKIVLRRLGLAPAYFCLYFIVPYFYLFAPTGRRAAQEFWSITHPEMGFGARQGAILRHLFRFGQVLMDRIYQGFFPDEKKFAFRSHGIEQLMESARSPRGLICVASHTGAWDLAALSLRHRDFGREFHVVHFEATGLRYDDLKEPDPAHLKNVRANAGAAEPPIFQMRAALANGNTIGIMGDRPLGARVELIPFFGKLAPFDVTAFRIAAACGCPLLFTFGFKSQNSAERAYDFFASEPKTYAYDSASPLSKPEQVLAWATEYVRELEAKVKIYPEQWFNFFPFWSTLPPIASVDSPSPSPGGKSSHYCREELRTPPKQGVASVPGRAPIDELPSRS